jgi:hypothetical protein
MTTMDIQFFIILAPTASLAVFLLCDWWARERRDAKADQRHDPAVFGWADMRVEARARMAAAVRALAINQYIRRVG